MATVTIEANAKSHKNFRKTYKFIGGPSSKNPADFIDQLAANSEVVLVEMKMPNGISSSYALAVKKAPRQAREINKSSDWNMMVAFSKKSTK